MAQNNFSTFAFKLFLAIVTAGFLSAFAFFFSSSLDVVSLKAAVIEQNKSVEIMGEKIDAVYWYLIERNKVKLPDKLKKKAE